ncbi:trigger factor [Kangiella profundi]|uniref:Trigger factor n=1 Tax=Kangiella profundi TaxID=1561924 RepID=A0A2K9AWA3_9GAMM|nr:trigger factor [Kangiella profundi]AUD79401.1 trigger factor [Kangiella profundi]GGE98828.1 trigger factor [Kangiella profundi]
MQVSVETTNGLERKLIIDVPAENIDGAVEKRLQDLARNVKMNGFRPGKVPFSVVKKRYGASVRQEVLGDVMQRHYFEAVQQEKLMPAGYPQLELIENNDGANLKFSATFEVYPEVKLADLDSIEIEKATSEVSDEDLTKMMDTLRGQRASWVEVKRKSKDGDQVVIDFKGFIDGEAFKGGEAKEFPLELGAGNMIPGFEEQLVGVSAGDDVEVKVTFPEDYHVDDLKGKEATFETHVHVVNKKELPTVTELAEQLGADDINSLKADVKKNMERELRNAIKSRVKGQVMNQLVEKHEVEVPKAMLDQEIERMRQEMAQQMRAPKDQTPDLPASLFEEQATRRVKLGLVVSEIIKAEGLKADEEKVRAQVEDLAGVYEEPQEVIDWYYGDPNRLREVESLVLEDTVVDLVLEKAKVTEKSVSFDELLNPNKNQD